MVLLSCRAQISRKSGNFFKISVPVNIMRKDKALPCLYIYRDILLFTY